MLERRGTCLIKQPILSVRGIARGLATPWSCRNIDFDLYPGEVHALVGENGAGKSTLTKIISGLYPADSGEIILDGKPVSINSPAAAQHLGIALIHQEPLSFPDLDVAENIFIGRQPRDQQNGIARLGGHVPGCLTMLTNWACTSTPRQSPRSVDCRPADGGDGQRSFAECPRAHHGRANRRPYAQ